MLHYLLLMCTWATVLYQKSKHQNFSSKWRNDLENKPEEHAMPFSLAMYKLGDMKKYINIKKKM